MHRPKRLPPLPPPPYSGSSSSGSRDITPSYPSPSSRSLTTLLPHHPVTAPDMHSQSRPHTAHPELWTEQWADDPFAAQVPATRSQFSPRVTASTLSSSRSFTETSSSSLSLSIPAFPPPPMPLNSNFLFPAPRTKSVSSAKSRSAFSMSSSKISKATRSATAWFSGKSSAEGTPEGHKKRHPTESEAVAQATRMRGDEDPRKAGIRAQASEAVKSSLRSWLTRDFSDQESAAVLQKCDKICTNGGIDLSVVLQEPLLDGKPPVYWAILNGTTDARSGDAALHALVLSLLEACRPLKETTIASVRLACMMTSNNVLLQHLFWHFPAISPLTRSDSMLLNSGAGGDIVDVGESQDGTGTFAARFQIRRFRLRMRVSKHIKIEFVTSDRLWTVTFSVGTMGRSESQWLLSFGLGENSVPACVDGDFVVLRPSPSTERGVDYEHTFSLPLGQNPSNLQPGPENAIKMRLDEGPMRPHLLNESLALVDRDGTLHAQFNVKLTQARPRVLSPLSTDHSDGSSLRSSALKSTLSKAPRSLLFTSKDKRKPDKEPKVYTSLRRGGR